MARSKYIYIVSFSPYDGVIAAFTVKHEMISWLIRHKYLQNGELCCFIERVPDSQYDSDKIAADITDEIEEFLKTEGHDNQR